MGRGRGTKRLPRHLGGGEGAGGSVGAKGSGGVESGPRTFSGVQALGAGSVASGQETTPRLGACRPSAGRVLLKVPLRSRPLDPSSGGQLYRGGRGWSMKVSGAGGGDGVGGGWVRISAGGGEPVNRLVRISAGGCLLREGFLAHTHPPALRLATRNHATPHASRRYRHTCGARRSSSRNVLSADLQSSQAWASCGLRRQAHGLRADRRAGNQRRS